LVCPPWGEKSQYRHTSSDQLLLDLYRWTIIRRTECGCDTGGSWRMAQPETNFGEEVVLVMHLYGSGSSKEEEGKE